MPRLSTDDNTERVRRTTITATTEVEPDVNEGANDIPMPEPVSQDESDESVSIEDITPEVEAPHLILPSFTGTNEDGMTDKEALLILMYEIGKPLIARTTFTENEQDFYYRHRHGGPSGVDDFESISFLNVPGTLGGVQLVPINVYVNLGSSGFVKTFDNNRAFSPLILFLSDCGVAAARELLIRKAFEKIKVANDIEVAHRWAEKIESVFMDDPMTLGYIDNSRENSYINRIGVAINEHRDSIMDGINNVTMSQSSKTFLLQLKHDWDNNYECSSTRWNFRHGKWIDHINNQDINEELTKQLFDIGLVQYSYTGSSNDPIGINISQDGMAVVRNILSQRDNNENNSRNARGRRRLEDFRPT